VKIDKEAAATIVREEDAAATNGDVNAAWKAKIEKLSQLCEDSGFKTHIAFLGTAVVAKAIDRSVDLYAVKPKHARATANAYSARSLCHSVLVPLSAELGFNIGVTGREPLNNQPYFRMTRLDDGTPVHQGSRAAFTFMLELVAELAKLTTTEEDAREALRAFISVRRDYVRKHSARPGETQITPEQLVTAVKALILDNSEGGKRAQAVVAGLLDVFAGIDRVESGRVNDPSRKYPGDVCVRSAADDEEWDKAFEVRDKPVTAADVQIFAAKCIEMGVREAAVVMVADKQTVLDAEALDAWASERGMSLSLFHGWGSIIDQALFWSELPKLDGAREAVAFIHDRLQSVEASKEAVTLWEKLSGS
jgi:SacI restriction endonuclease